MITPTSLESWIAARNQETSAFAAQLRQQRPRGSSLLLWRRLVLGPLIRWPWVLRPVAGRAELSARWIRRALEAWTEFVVWAKWWEAGLAREAPPAGAPEDAPRAAVAAPEAARERLTVLLLTKNEGTRLPGCLASVRWADDVVVVDGQSQDRTVEIARAFGATVVARPFSGSFAQERNAGLDAASGDWVLQMDADETVSPELRAAVQRLLRDGSAHAALKIRRRNYFLGHQMRYGGWYHYNLVLFRRDRARYHGLVHERLAVQGTIGVLDGDLVHRPFDSLAQFIDRQNRYTTLQARELLARADRPDEGLMARQLRLRPRKVWWKIYVKKQGFREGMWGLVFAVLFAWVDLLIWAKCWEAAHVRRE